MVSNRHSWGDYRIKCSTLPECSDEFCSVPMFGVLKRQTYRRFRDRILSRWFPTWILEILGFRGAFLSRWRAEILRNSKVPPPIFDSMVAVCEIMTFDCRCRDGLRISARFQLQFNISVVIRRRSQTELQ